MLAAQLLDRNPCLSPLQRPNDLLFRKPFLQLRSLRRKRTLLACQWHCLLGAPQLGAHLDIQRSDTGGQLGDNFWYPAA